MYVYMYADVNTLTYTRTYIHAHTTAHVHKHTITNEYAHTYHTHTYIHTYIRVQGQANSVHGAKHNKCSEWLHIHTQTQPDIVVLTALPSKVRHTSWHYADSRTDRHMQSMTKAVLQRINMCLMLQRINMCLFLLQ